VVASVIVVAYESERVISQCLRSLEKQQSPFKFEVIVVSSGLDNTRTIVHHCFSWVRFIGSEKRLFPGQARNVGIKAARGRYILFLPSDCTVPSDWIARRIKAHMKGFSCVRGVVMPVKTWNPISLSEYWIEYSDMMKRRSSGLVHDKIPHNISFKSSVFDEVGMYSEELEAGEDTLFNSKIMKKGVEIYFDPDIIMYHKGSTGLAGLVRHQFKHGQELAKYRLLEATSSWKSRSMFRKFLSLSFVFLIKRIFITYRRIFLFKPRLFLYSILCSPFIVLGISAISIGACKQLLFPRVFQD